MSPIRNVKIWKRSSRKYPPVSIHETNELITGVMEELALLKENEDGSPYVNSSLRLALI